MTERGMSGYALARRIPCDRGLISRYVNGKQQPSRRLAQRIDQVLGADGSLVAQHAEDDIRRGRSAQTKAHDPVSDQTRHAQDMLDLADDMNRRELLRIMAMTGTVLALNADTDTDWDRLTYFSERGGKLDGEAVEEYAALTSYLWRVFVLSRTKHVVLPLVRDQLEVLTGSFGRTNGPAMYRRLCEVTASLFQLAGEILFDANQYTDAAQCYTLAATASKEARMPDLWACALIRHAFIGVFERRFDKSAAMLELAASIAQRGNTTLATRHWVAIVQAQAAAGLGELEACQRALDIAGQVDDLTGDFQNGGWLRFDGSRLAEERGACYVQLQRPDLAESALTAALRLNLSARRRGSVLTDLAILGAQRRDPEQIVTHAEGALDLISQTGSGVIAHKIVGLRPHLEPFLGNPRIRDLSDRIAAIGV
jgi:transcriptional regulator with XRE-family HTH domain